MIYLCLFYEFFKIGLFSLGGGLATIPFLSELGTKYGWYTEKELTHMIAISESTPGPIGINMATYVGYKTAGYLGAIVSTLSEVAPAIIIIIIISKILNHFSNNTFIKNMFKIIRPCTFGLIVSATLNIFFNSVILLNNYKETGKILSIFEPKVILIFIVIYIFNKKTKYHPIVYIVISALLGIILAV